MSYLEEHQLEIGSLYLCKLYLGNHVVLRFLGNYTFEDEFGCKEDIFDNPYDEGVVRYVMLKVEA